MESTVILATASRGVVVAVDDLGQALQDGRLAGAPLDMLKDEPSTGGKHLRSPPDVILTPHASWDSAAFRPELRRGAARIAVWISTWPVAVRQA